MLQIVLRVTSGPHEGREFTFHGHDNFIVGRAKSAQFRLSTKDQYFSRNHFLIEVNPPLCRLLDAKIDAQPQPFDRFEIIEEIGRGGMGVVYRARDRHDGSFVALKVVLPAVASSPEDLARFIREAGIVQKLSHPHIVPYRDLGHARGQLYFAMQLVPGTDLQTILRQHHGPLAYHASTLSGLTTTGSIGGTLPYMAPEQITNYRNVTPAADQYSAAATLYYLLTRSYIYDFPVDIASKLLMVLQEPPRPIELRRPDIPEKLSAIIHKGLARPPAQRFADVSHFRKALQLCMRNA